MEVQVGLAQLSSEFSSEGKEIPMSSFAEQSYFGNNIELVLNLWGKIPLLLVMTFIFSLSLAR